MKKVKKPSRKTLIREADDSFAAFIRSRDRRIYGGKCPLPNADGGACTFNIQCCFHWISAAKYSLRWDEDNAIGACLGHNKGHEYNPLPNYMWLIQQRGLEWVEALIARSAKKRKIKDAELATISGAYEHRLQWLGKEHLLVGNRVSECKPKGTPAGLEAGDLKAGVVPSGDG